jgi:eukaryotic translation initiation factor 2C
MAPKGKNKGGGGKKKAKGNQTAPGELSTQQRDNITQNFGAYSKSDIAKQEYWKNGIGPSRTDAANAFWDELKQQHDAAQASTPTVPGPPQVSNSMQAQGFLTQPAGFSPATKPGAAPNRLRPPVNANLVSAPHSTTAEDLQTGLVADLESLSLNGEGDAGDEELEEQDESNATGEELVNNEDTSRTMAPAADPVLHASNGIAHSINIMDISEKLGTTEQANDAKFPIRMDLQKTTTNVFTNRFEVIIDDDATFHEFQIVGVPEGRSKRMNKMFIDTVIEKSPVLHGNQNFFATDNLKTIIAWKDLRKDLEAAGSRTGDGEGWHLLDLQDGNDGGLVHLYLRHIRVVDTAGLKRYVASESSSGNWNPMTWNESTTMDALNIVVSKCFGSGIVRTVANKFFVESGWSQLGTSPLCTIRGYYFSTRPGMGKVLLNVNACTSAFFRPILLSELMAMASNGPHYYSSPLRVTA